MEEDIIVADTNNHRIQVFEKSGEFKYQFGIPGMQIYTKNKSLEVSLKKCISFWMKVLAHENRLI